MLLIITLDKRGVISGDVAYLAVVVNVDTIALGEFNHEGDTSKQDSVIALVEECLGA